MRPTQTNSGSKLGLNLAQLLCIFTIINQIDVKCINLNILLKKKIILMLIANMNIHFNLNGTLFYD
jgi:hypothetical protein